MKRHPPIGGAPPFPIVKTNQHLRMFTVSAAVEPPPGTGARTLWRPSHWKMSRQRAGPLDDAIIRRANLAVNWFRAVVCGVAEVGRCWERRSALPAGRALGGARCGRSPGPPHGRPSNALSPARAAGSRSGRSASGGLAIGATRSIEQADMNGGPAAGNGDRPPETRCIKATPTRR